MYVYQSALLSAGEKLRILKALVGKVLTLASSRDLIEDCVEEQRAARHELRDIRAEQHRRGREEAAHRYIQNMCGHNLLTSTHNLRSIQPRYLTM